MLKGIGGTSLISGIRQYACSLAAEMKVYCVNQLSMVHRDLSSLIDSRKKSRRSKHSKKRPRSLTMKNQSTMGVTDDEKTVNTAWTMMSADKPSQTQEIMEEEESTMSRLQGRYG